MSNAKPLEGTCLGRAEYRARKNSPNLIVRGKIFFGGISFPSVSLDT